MQESLKPSSSHKILDVMTILWIYVAALGWMVRHGSHANSLDDILVLLSLHSLHIIIGTICLDSYLSGHSRDATEGKWSKSNYGLFVISYLYLYLLQWGWRIGHWMLEKAVSYLGMKIVMLNRESVEKTGPAIFVLEVILSFLCL